MAGTIIKNSKKEDFYVVFLSDGERGRFKIGQYNRKIVTSRYAKAEKVKKQQAEEKAKHELALKEVEKKIAKVAQAESEKLKKEIERKDKAREIQDKRHEKRIDEMKKQMKALLHPPRL